MKADTPQSVVVECDLPEPPEKVWRALTEKDLLGAWLMPNDMRPEVGARFHFQPGREDGGGGSLIDCEVLEAEPHRTLRWRQRESGNSAADGQSVESVVTIELVARPEGGTHLRLVHDGFEIVSREQAEPSFAPEACATVIPFKRRVLDRRCQEKSAAPIVCPLRRAA
jgi:uncharacterized protein YndB with AHSA1/START domain